jgi:hypothetical protein
MRSISNNLKLGKYLRISLKAEKIKETCVELAGHKTFQIKISSQQSGRKKMM